MPTCPGPGGQRGGRVRRGLPRAKAWRCIPGGGAGGLQELGRHSWLLLLCLEQLWRLRVFPACDRPLVSAPPPKKDPPPPLCPHPGTPSPLSQTGGPSFAGAKHWSLSNGLQLPVLAVVIYRGHQPNFPGRGPEPTAERGEAGLPRLLARNVYRSTAVTFHTQAAFPGPRLTDTPPPREHNPIRATHTHAQKEPDSLFLA